jgi:hypothetical protein
MDQRHAHLSNEENLNPGLACLPEQGSVRRRSLGRIQAHQVSISSRGDKNRAVSCGRNVDDSFQSNLRYHGRALFPNRHELGG